MGAGPDSRVAFEMRWIMDKRKTSSVSISRRKLLVGGAAAIVGTALSTKSLSALAAASDREIRVGFICPQSGPMADLSGMFGLQLARGILARGITIAGESYRVTILDRDSQSSPSRASQLAGDLITNHQVHLMLAFSTPETVNPVADACEAAGVPCLATACPLEPFYFGRGAKPGASSPFKWTFDFSFGVGQYITAYMSMWDMLLTNKKVGVMYPNDADGAAFRQHMVPAIEKHGYKIIDPGAYQDGTTDYSAQIALFNREDCQIFNTISLPPDFNTFWRQAAQLHYTQKVLIAQVTKTGLFPAQVMPLGNLGYGLAGTTVWSPVFPYTSPLTGMSSQQLSDAYEKAVNQPWTQNVGSSMSLFEVAVEVLKGAKDPTSRTAIRDVIPTLDMVSTVGRVNFKHGPYPNCAATPQIGAQWVKAAQSAKYPLDFVTVSHINDPNVPIQRKLVAYNSNRA